MHRNGLILVFQTGRYELVGTGNHIHEVGTALNHALVDELAEGFVFAHVAQVIEELVPETAVNQVAGGMLRTAHVEIYAAPVFVGLPGHQALGVVRVHVTQVVGAGTGESGHGALFQRITLVGPVLGAGQRRLAVLGGFVLVYLRQREGQVLEGNGRSHTVLVIDGERLSPVALAGEDGVADTVIHLPPAHPVFLHIVDGGGNGLAHGKAVEKAAVAHDALFGVHAFLAHIGPFDDGDNGEAEFLGKGIVSAVVGGNGHDGARSVTGQHILGNPYRHLLPGHGVDAVSTRENARDGLSGHPFALGLLLHLFQIGFHLRLLRGRRELGHPLALRSQHHEGNPEDGIGPGGEDGDVVFPVVTFYREHHFRSLAAAYPVALHLLEGVCPVQLLQPVQQTAGIGAYPKLPLRHFLLEHRVAAALRIAVLHLVVGQYSAQGGAPVHGALPQIGQAVAHQGIGLFLI